jgi:hypothetical protein
VTYILCNNEINDRTKDTKHAKYSQRNYRFRIHAIKFATQAKSSKIEPNIHYDNHYITIHLHQLYKIQPLQRKIAFNSNSYLRTFIVLFNV